MGANFLGVGAIEVGLGGGNVFTAVAILALLVFGFGFSGGGAGLGNIFGARTGVGFLPSGARLFQGGLQFLVVKGDQNLAGLNRIAFADENFVDAAANLEPTRM